jgi:NADPH:quinone reductase
MRAVTFSRFGGPEVLEVIDLPEPVPGPGEVRIRVAAATVNPTDVGFRSGRQAGQLGSDVKPPFIPGMELAGTVDQAGPGARWQVGQQVMAIVMPRRAAGGAMAEVVVVPEDSVAELPKGASPEQAATLPMNGLTVRLALDALALSPGQFLLVTGAAGAVGGYAVELGIADGLRVIAIAGPQDEPLMKQMGVSLFVPRGDNLAERVRAAVPGGVDAVVDAALIGPPILAAIKDGGRLAAVRGWEGGTERDIEITQVRVAEYLQNQKALAELGRLASDGKLTLRVSETFPPERTGEAQEKLIAGGVRGRLVIVF